MRIAISWVSGDGGPVIVHRSLPAAVRLRDVAAWQWPLQPREHSSGSVLWHKQQDVNLASVLGLGCDAPKVESCLSRLSQGCSWLQGASHRCSIVVPALSAMVSEGVLCGSGMLTPATSQLCLVVSWLAGWLCTCCIGLLSEPTQLCPHLAFPASQGLRPGYCVPSLRTNIRATAIDLP
jgi:hypothetical protein